MYKEEGFCLRSHTTLVSNPRRVYKEEGFCWRNHLRHPRLAAAAVAPHIEEQESKPKKGGCFYDVVGKDTTAVHSSSRHR